LSCKVYISRVYKKNFFEYYKQIENNVINYCAYEFKIYIPSIFTYQLSVESILSQILPLNMTPVGTD